MKTVSVIIPTYNPQKYIYECLNSLEKQTLSKENFEIIIILNGKKEPFFSEINRFIECKGNYKLLYSEKVGVSNARNLGLEKSQHEYVIFLDDDDYLSPNYLENMLTLAKPSEMVVSNLICFTDDDLQNKSNDYISDAFKKIKNKSPIKNNLFKTRKFFSAIGGKIIFRKDIGEVQFDTSVSKGEDSLFMSMISKNIFSVSLTGEDTIYYRRLKEKSLSRTKRKTVIIIKERILLIVKYIEIIILQKKNYLFHISRIGAQVSGGVKEILK